MPLTIATIEEMQDKFTYMINEMFSPTQRSLLKCALYAGAKVHFYGTGLGKSLLTDILRAADYTASEAGDFDTPGGPNYVPDDQDYVAFRVNPEPRSGSWTPEDIVRMRDVSLAKIVVDAWVFVF